MWGSGDGSFVRCEWSKPCYCIDVPLLRFGLGARRPSSRIISSVQWGTQRLSTRARLFPIRRNGESGYGDVVVHWECNQCRSNLFLNSSLKKCESGSVDVVDNWLCHQFRSNIFEGFDFVSLTVGNGVDLWKCIQIFGGDGWRTDWDDDFRGWWAIETKGFARSDFLFTTKEKRSKTSVQSLFSTKTRAILDRQPTSKSKWWIEEVERIGGQWRLSTMRIDECLNGYRLILSVVPNSFRIGGCAIWTILWLVCPKHIEWSNLSARRIVKVLVLQW